LATAPACAAPATSDDASRAPVDGSVEIPSDLGSSACGGEWTSSLCGGQSGLTFVYQVLADTSRVEPGSGLLYDNGAIFFMLRGDCHYWAQDRALRVRRSIAVVG
jgi:hypothetical protein